MCETAASSVPAPSMHERPDEQPLLAVHVAEPAEDRRADRGREQIAGEQPRHAGLGRVQAVLDRRQRGDDRRAEHRVRDAGAREHRQREVRRRAFTAAFYTKRSDRSALCHTRSMALRRDAQRNRDRLVAGAGELFAADGIDVPVEEITRRVASAWARSTGTSRRRRTSSTPCSRGPGAYVELAREAAGAEDAWVGLTGFLERGLELHASNGHMDVISTTRGVAHGRRRRESACGRCYVRSSPVRRRRGGCAKTSPPKTSRCLPRSGPRDRGDGRDAPSPRRYLALTVDGLGAEAATPLPVPPPTAEQVRRLT